MEKIAISWLPRSLTCTCRIFPSLDRGSIWWCNILTYIEGSVCILSYMPIFIHYISLEFINTEPTVHFFIYLGTLSLNCFKVWFWKQKRTHQCISMLLGIFSSLYLLMIHYMVSSIYLRLFFLSYGNWLSYSDLSPLFPIFCKSVTLICFSMPIIELNLFLSMTLWSSWSFLPLWY